MNQCRLKSEQAERVRGRDLGERPRVAVRSNPMVMMRNLAWEVFQSDA